jgi:glycosyltransferase involved in cell wall biosynthesis
LGGIPELVSDGENGFTCAPDDPEALADRMHELAARPQLALDMGRRARALVVAGFTPSLHLGRIGSLYAEAANVAEPVAV